MKKRKEEMFSNIVGYDDMKKTLVRVLDVLNNFEKYEKLGVKLPSGLLIYGPPGIGKTTIAQDFIKYVNREYFVVRKTKSNGNFMQYLENVFKQVKENQPSLILLDDLDKFAECDNQFNHEEFVAVQSLIDDIKGQNIFIIATANDIDVLPESLKRSGRFDIQIKLDNPKEDDSYKMIEYYLSNKPISEDVNIKNISYILYGSSCADLEKVCNQAGIYAGYKGKVKIGMEDLIRASLEWSYNTNIEHLEDEDDYTINIAYHEAGHALIGELVEPDSVSFVTVTKTDSDIEGITKYHENENYFNDIKFMENRVKTLLAGKAATEVVFGTCDTGANSDIRRAFNIVRRFVDNYCMFNFDSWYTYREEVSEKVKQSKDDRSHELLDNYYQEVKELLIKHRDKLDALARELEKKKILFQDEIEDIYNYPEKYSTITNFWKGDLI